MNKLFYATTEGLEIANHLEANGFSQDELKIFNLEENDENFNIIVDKENKKYWQVDSLCLNYTKGLATCLGQTVELITLNEISRWGI